MLKNFSLCLGLMIVTGMSVLKADPYCISKPNTPSSGWCMTTVEGTGTCINVMNPDGPKNCTGDQPEGPNG